MSRNRFAALVATVVTVLIPSIAAAAEEEEKGGGIGNGPFGIFGYFRTGWNWLEPFLVPDFEWEYWYIVLATIPLTYVWQAKASQKTKTFFNNFGGQVFFGTLALAVLLAFVGPFLGAMMFIVGKVTSLMNVGMNPSFGGFFKAVWQIILAIPFFLIIWLITRIPGLQGLIEKYIGLGKMLAGKIWSNADKVKNNPSLVWMIVGGTVITAIINGKFAMHITESFAFSGLIPGASALVGVWFFFYRTRPGNKLKDAAVVKTASKIRRLKPFANGTAPCINWGLLPLHNVKAWEKNEEEIPLKRNGKVRHKPNHICPGVFEPGQKKCGEGTCDAYNEFLDWKCPNTKCKKRGLKWDTPKCPDCGTKKPMRNWACPHCRYVGKSKKGIPWRTAKCPKCQKPRPKHFPTSLFHHPWDDEYTAPSAKPGKKRTKKVGNKPRKEGAAKEFKCPGCDETLETGFKKCPHCRMELPSEAASDASGTKSSKVIDFEKARKRHARKVRPMTTDEIMDSF